jgi:hypothetical protein
MAYVPAGNGDECFLIFWPMSFSLRAAFLLNVVLSAATDGILVASSNIDGRTNITAIMFEAHVKRIRDSALCTGQEGVSAKAKPMKFAA